MDLTGRIARMLAEGRSRVSEHGLREWGEGGIKLLDVIGGMANAVVVEEYPDFHKGPAVLFLVQDRDGRPVHVLWGIPKWEAETVTLVTAYRPLPDRWSEDFLRRVPK